MIESTLDALHELIPSDSVIFDEVSIADGRTRGATRPASLVEDWGHMMPTFEKWFHQSPNVQYFQQHPGGSARRWSDGDMDAFRATELYCEFMEPLGIHYQLSFTLPGGIDSQRSCILNRGDRDFTDAEVAICNEIAPYLSALFSTSKQRTVGLVEGLNSSRAWTAYIVNQAGRVTNGPDPSESSPIPDTGVRRWVLQQFDQRDLRASVEAVSDEITLDDGGVTHVQLLPDPAGSHVLIMSKPQRTGLNEAFLAGLSTRQREVMIELAGGGTNREVAARLGISVETVKKHLSAIYRALEVSDRASAVAAARWSLNE